jgi:hypothetical protein
MRRKLEAILAKVWLRQRIEVLTDEDDSDILIPYDDEYEHPYWYYHEVNCACTKCMPDFKD